MHSDDAAAPPEKRARYKKCPICFDSIYISETRPVRWYEGQEGEPPREGGDVVLRLVKRKAGSTLAMPRESAETVAKGEDIPWYFAAEVMDYARMMKGGQDYMLAQFDEALAAVDILEKEDELMFGEDAEWTGRAKRTLHEAKEKVMGIGNPPPQPKKPEPAELRHDSRPVIKFNESDDGVPEMYLQRHTAITPFDVAKVDDSSVTESPIHDPNHVPRTLQEMRQRQMEKPQPSEYLFYHALQHFYLSPLDIRILKSAFGSYHTFPSSILPRVERVTTGHIVDDDLRKRVRYLGHLPHGCEVGFLECDWTDTVSPAVLEEYKPMLERRRKRHDEKEAREEKDRIRIEKAEERELAAVRRKRPSISNDAFSAELPGLTDGTDGTHPGSPPWAHRTTSGFASLASPSTSPNMQRTVWGTTAVGSGSPDLHATDGDLSSQDDGWLQGWERDMLDHQHEDFTAGMEDLSVETAQAPKAAAGKKGKKGKKITLMSTTARRGA